MPYTLNGIGTHYYGARNRSARVGECASCNKSTTLSSYDTREWFCVIFVPLIPLNRYRVIDDCASCRKHHRMALDDFNANVANTVAPLREAVQRSPRDAAAHAELVRALIGMEVRHEAATEVEAAVGKHPANADLNLLGGQLAIESADWNRALPYFTKAYAVEPQNPAISYGYGWLLHQLGQNEQAIPPLQRAVTHEESRLNALYILGSAQLKLSRWNEALQSFQQMLSLEPAYAADKALMRMVADCKKQLGYQLTPAEKKAGRKWWPFGGGARKQPRLESQPGLVRPSLRYAGIALLVLVAAGVGFAGWDSKTNIEVWFDNASNGPVEIDLDGRRWTLSANSHTRESVKEGSHTVVVRDGKGRSEIERHTFNVEEAGFFDALFGERFFVYNVSGRRVYRRAVLKYAKNAGDQSYDEQLIAMQRFFEQRGVDFPFADAPTSISADSRSSSVKKVSFNAAQDVDLIGYSMMNLQQGKNKEAAKAIDYAVSLAPCETHARRMQMLVASIVQPADGGVSAARQWISDCAENDLEAHRAYQDAHTQHGKSELMRTEYAAKVAAAPESGKMHYLFGRVAADSAVAVREHTEALRLEPELVWPRVAIGHAHAMEGRYAEAMREFGAALEMKGRDPAIVVYYATAAIANETPADAVETVERVRAAAKLEPSAIEARWLLAVAVQDWGTVAKLQKSFERIDGPESACWRNLKVLRIRGDEAATDGSIKRALRDDPTRALAVRAQIERAIEKGELAAAAEGIRTSREILDPSLLALLAIYTAGAYHLDGDDFAAAKMIAEAEQILGEPDDRQWFVRALLDGVKGTRPVDEVLSLAREANSIQHGWFVAAVRAKNRAAAVDNLTRASRASADLEFPYLEAKAMVGRLSPPSRRQ